MNWTFKRNLHLLVLMGHENDGAGKLSPIAEDRCKHAAALVKADPQAKILPTGALGDFNKSPTPHGVLLANYLEGLGVPPNRILRNTNTASTVQDVLEAIAFVKRACGLRTVTVITSEFHVERVKLLCQALRDKKEPAWKTRWLTRLLAPLLSLYRRFTCKDDPEWIFDPVSHSFAHKKEISEEMAKIESVRRALGSNFEPGKPLGSIYDNASIEHKHYDSVSLAILTGVVVAFSFPLLMLQRLMDRPLLVVGVIGAFVVLIRIGLDMYRRVADLAHLARKRMVEIELATECAGFSTMYYTHFSAGKPGIKELIVRATNWMSFVLVVVGAVVLVRYLAGTLSRAPAEIWPWHHFRW